MNVFIGRVIQEQGARIHELWHYRGYYLLKLYVRELGERRHMVHADRIITDRQAGEWVDMCRAGIGYVPDEKATA